MLSFQITEGEVSSFESAILHEMQGPIKHFEKELVSIRTGRASTKLIESIKVEAYGQEMQLKEVASLAAPDARLLTVQPWDKTIIGDIEKGLLASDLGITPANDGELIRLQLPQMTTDRRDELVKILSKKAEECRVGVRSVRKDFQNLVRDAEKKNDISEDFAKRLQDVLQKLTDNTIKKVEEMVEKKSADIKHV